MCVSFTNQSTNKHAPNQEPFYFKEVNLHEIDDELKSTPTRTHDSVNHPGHYTQGNIECMDAMREMMGSSYCLQPSANGGKPKNLPHITFYWWGCIFKYIWRWPRKNGVEDLRKARFYLDLLIDKVGE